MDVFYIVSSTLFLAIFFVGNIARRGRTNAETHLAAIFCLLMFAISVATLILASISFDFGIDCYPSRQSPYLTSGRLIMGTVVPFLIMYLGGLELLLNRLRIGFARLLLLIIIADLMVISEITYSMQVFESQYNWFHLP